VTPPCCVPDIGPRRHRLEQRPRLRPTFAEHFRDDPGIHRFGVSDDFGGHPMVTGSHGIAIPDALGVERVHIVGQLEAAASASMPSRTRIACTGW